VNVAAFKQHIPASVEIYGKVAAIVYLAACHGELRAARSVYADGAAAVKSAGIHLCLAAMIEIQHAAEAIARLFGMPEGHAAYFKAIAVIEVENICITGYDGDDGIFSAFAHDAEIIN